MRGPQPDDPWNDEDEGEEATFDSADESGSADGEDGNSEAMFFTVTNPPGSVSVTVLMDGRPVRVDLTSQVVHMTESRLSEEIALIAGLACQNARAGQHVMIVGMMTRLGHDRTATRSYVEHELGMPSPDAVLAAQARIFATRYSDDED